MWINKYNKDLIVTNEDECLIAEWVGWKGICANKYGGYTGYPTDEEIEFMGSTRKRKAKRGESFIPWYHCDADEMLRVEKLIEQRGLKEKYIKVISGYLKLNNLSESERMWQLAHLSPNVKCYALLITIGHALYDIDKHCENKCVS